MMHLAASTKEAANLVDFTFTFSGVDFKAYIQIEKKS